MANRAKQLTEEQNGRRISVSLLSRARGHVNRLPQLRIDGVDVNEEVILTSLVQFDVLSILAAIAHKQGIGAAHQAHFGLFHDWRSVPIVQRLLDDEALRRAVFPPDDENLARALRAVEHEGVRAGWDYAGFHGFRKEITDWIDARTPQTPSG